MQWRRLAFPLCLVTVASCAPQAPLGATADDPFAVAQEQAVELGKVMGGLRLCDEIAWQTTFQEFMTAKRAQGLDDKQTALIAAWTGIGESQAGPELLECSAKGAARRAAAIEEMRPTW